jgi:hypothetical protein
MKAGIKAKTGRSRKMPIMIPQNALNFFGLNRWVNSQHAASLEGWTFGKSSPQTSADCGTKRVSSKKTSRTRPG